ncbi:hypothetical protein [Streptomyces acidicola]|uniref:hypothetical protein n=1 Tax=Streptomyces acidicola TaxID=2596892 RepID=UPI00381C8816
MKKLSVTLFAATAIATLGLSGTAMAASSGDVSTMGWPTGCTNGKFDGPLGAKDGWQATCSNSNGGRYKALIICTPILGGNKITLEAPVWTTSGKSIVYCPPYTVRSSGGIMERSY